MYNREIYCNFETIMVSKWSDTPLTQCPHNAAHSVVLESDSIIEVARLTDQLATLFATSSTGYIDITKFVYQGTDFYDNDRVNPKYVKIWASISFGTYDFQLLDQDSNVLWNSTGNTGAQIITIDFDLISKPTLQNLLNLQVRTSGGTVNIANVSMFQAIAPE